MNIKKRRRKKSMKFMEHDVKRILIRFIICSMLIHLLQRYELEIREQRSELYISRAFFPLTALGTPKHFCDFVIAKSN